MVRRKEICGVEKINTWVKHRKENETNTFAECQNKAE